MQIFKFPSFCTPFCSNDPKCINKIWKIATYPRFKLSRRIIRNLHLKTFLHFILNTRRMIYIYTNKQPTKTTYEYPFSRYYRITMPTFISKSSLHLMQGGKKKKEKRKIEKKEIDTCSNRFYSRSFRDAHYTCIAHWAFAWKDICLVNEARLFKAVSRIVAWLFVRRHVNCYWRRLFIVLGI